MEDSVLHSCICLVVYLPDRVVLSKYFRIAPDFFFCCSNSVVVHLTPVTSAFFFLLIKYIQSKMDHWTVFIHHRNDLDANVTFTVI